MPNLAQMSEAFDIGFREGLEACVVAALMLALVAPPLTAGSRRTFATWIVGGTAAGVAVSVVIYDAAGTVTSDVVEGIELAATAVAVVMLTATALWTSRLARDDAFGVNPRVAAIVAALSVGRETIEATCFVLEADGGAGRQVVALLTGVALAAAVSALLFGAALARAGRRARCIVAQALLVLVAAGMCMSLVRAAGHVGWIPDERPVWLEIPRLAEPSSAAIRAAVSAFGVRAELSATECLVWAAYMAVVGTVVARRWGVGRRLDTGTAPGHPDVRQDGRS